ncbi:asparagine synthetase B family protein [Aliiglaciecola sp. CAU 1673]|uniref:asparagine synthase-related protein n=1 Tax=Aliiglaciecola sp. CAU 1673 TaxID=3032595 RepID=UPI0023DA7E37|nr:asparagine synthetase B family protein [Aliiglaciecola sp. CAU 1673]MDF2177295.1 asparagine synthetase B family protein [Aliiglaciecola sp. CAU 1673]
MGSIELHKQAQNRPYLHLSCANQQLKTEGVASCSLGKPININDGAEQADGIYLNWQWDGQELNASNDRYGMYPLYYAAFNGEIVISPSIFPILNTSVPKDLDYAALAILFRIGHVIGNDTPFRHIKVLPPNSRLRWREGKLEIQSTPVTSCFANNQRLSYDDAVDGYLHYFRQSVSRRLPGDERFTMPISGGRDSRNILFELHRQGATPQRCVTLRYRPPATNEDERVARLICQRLDIVHDIIDKPENWFDAVLEDIYLTNFCGGGHSWALPLADYFREHQVTTIYDGLAGGIISSGQTLDVNKDKLFREERLEELALLLLNEASFEGFNKDGLVADFYQKIDMQLAVERLVEELKRHLNTGSPALSYTFWNRTRRAVSAIPFSIMSGVDTVHCPYLDRDFFDFCTGLDAAYILTHKFHDDVIARGYPSLADLPYEDKSIKAQYDQEASRYYHRAVLDYSGYLLKRGMGGSALMKNRFSWSRVLNDLVRRPQDQAWYLRRCLYGYELEKLAQID